MKPEKRQLLDELLGESSDPRRAATLLAGNRLLRTRRWRRRVVQTCALITLLGVTAIGLQRLLVSAPETKLATVAPAPKHTVVPEVAPLTDEKTDPIERLTDQELLALFPDTPDCLATWDNGQKRLIFLRVEDAEKFVGRL